MNEKTCPECGSPKLLVYEETSYDLNSGEFYCHSVKAHDSDAKVRCQESDCGWTGQHQQVKGYEHESDTGI